MHITMLYLVDKDYTIADWFKPTDFKHIHRNPLVDGYLPYIVAVLKEAELDLETYLDIYGCVKYTKSFRLFEEYFDCPKIKKALSRNPDAVEYLLQHRNLIDYPAVSRNPEAGEIINDEKEAWRLSPPTEGKFNKDDYFDWAGLSTNPAAAKVIDSHQDKVNPDRIIMNPAICELPEKLRPSLTNLGIFGMFALAQHPGGLKFMCRGTGGDETKGIFCKEVIRQYRDLHWEDQVLFDRLLSKNPAAINFLKNYKYMILPVALNENPEAGPILLANKEYIRPKILVGNPKAYGYIKERCPEFELKRSTHAACRNEHLIDIIREKVTVRNIRYVMENPAIFELDRATYKKSMERMTAEIRKACSQ